MNTAQLISTVVAGVIIAAILALARMVTGKADKTAVAEIKGDIEAKAEKVELNRVESESKAANAKLEVKLDAALLIVATSITRPELAEKILAMTGRADDKMARVVADIVQLTTDQKVNAKAIVETEKKLDDIPARMRTVEENQKRN